jgi:ubiquinone/menaquinone biosynthesis C-methylase UbiE
MTHDVTPPTPDALDRLFRQKYGDPGRVGWAPARRHQYGYYTTSDMYEALVAELVPEGGAWIDVGGGHNVFPENAPLAERLVAKCATMVAVDPSDNVRKNRFATEWAQCLIQHYVTDQRFDLATLRMVVEHVEDPPEVTAALSRLLRPGGLAVVLTVNRWAPLTVLSRLTPFALHHPIKRVFWGSEQEDTFPVRYRMNSRRTLRRVFETAGFEECFFTKLDDLSTWSQFRRMNHVELGIWRLLRLAGIAYPENCLLGVYRRLG